MDDRSYMFSIHRFAHQLGLVAVDNLKLRAQLVVFHDIEDHSVERKRFEIPFLQLAS